MRSGLKETHFNVSGLEFDYASGTDMTVTNVTTTNFERTGDDSLTAGSPYGVGDTLKGFNAEAIISGGMWVIGSKHVLKPAPASTQFPLGIAKATVASGAECEVLVGGPHYMVAEGTVGAGTSVKMGAGAALNCVVANGASSGARATVMAGAGSEGMALIFLL